jgi:hypothetical protein
MVTSVFASAGEAVIEQLSKVTKLLGKAKEFVDMASDAVSGMHTDGEGK